MKTIYEFTLKKKVKKQVEEKRTTKEGEEEIVLVNKTVSVPVKFVVKKPTRRLVDDAEVFYSVQLSKAIKMGIVTKAMLVKKYADNGGALSEEENKHLLKSLKALNDMQNEYQLLEVSKKKEDEQKKEELKLKIVSLQREMQELEASLQSVYEHTADAKAEQETLLWYASSLAQIETEGGFKDFFEGDDFEEKREDLYEKFEDEKGFDYEATSIICKVIGYWVYNQNCEKKDIEKFIKNGQ